MRSLPPQLSFADLELQFQGVHLDPSLRAISEFLDQHLTLIEQVRKDLERGLKNTRTGRNGIAPSQVFRSLVLMRYKNWDYRELRERINDGCTLRSFTEFDCQPVPKHDAFNRAFNRLTPETLRDINQLVIQAAVQLGLEDGKSLRVDTTVVESNVHYPTDATLLWDSVRTITRLIEDLHEKLPGGVQGFTNRTRSARRRMQAIQRMSAAERSQQQEPKYRELIGIPEQVVNNARQVVEKAKAAAAGTGADLIASLGIDSLRNEITGYCQLADRVIDQSRRRVLQGGNLLFRHSSWAVALPKGEKVPTEEKIYSIFEPHTDLIKRGKAQKPVEFGHKVFLAESAQGLITDYQVLDGNPSDTTHVPSSLDRHQQTFDRSPELYATDRGFFSTDNVQACEKAGVIQISIPQRGGHKTAEQDALERSKAFKQAQRFRAGIEGRISVLFRGRGMKRCQFKGRQHFELLVGAAVLTNNLLRIADLLNNNRKITVPRAA
jgi:transposase, IS5 family